MDKPISNIHFKFMSFGCKFRDLFRLPKNKLNEIGIKSGFHILDYGCGPGNYSIVAAQLVGNSGKVYALDIHPLGIKIVQEMASDKGITNIENICSDCATGLEDRSIDVVLLYDTFHDLMDPDGVLKELHRILEPNFILSFSDHHMKEDEILSEIIKKPCLNYQGKKKDHISF
ncbi:MAG: class I SAM-dependent methyltransferase [Deltaproteobacteria bacterium]|nr:class I SAM-dependent methyltransferase [Deltaproteobacteria bacterium]